MNEQKMRWKRLNSTLFCMCDDNEYGCSMPSCVFRSRAAKKSGEQHRKNYTKTPPNFFFHRFSLYSKLFFMAICDYKKLFWAFCLFGSVVSFVNWFFIAHHGHSDSNKTGDGNRCGQCLLKGKTLNELEINVYCSLNNGFGCDGKGRGERMQLWWRLKWNCQGGGGVGAFIKLLG